MSSSALTSASASASALTECILPRDPTSRTPEDKTFAAYLTTLLGNTGPIEAVSAEERAGNAAAAVGGAGAPRVEPVEVDDTKFIPLGPARKFEPLGIAFSNAGANASMTDLDAPKRKGLELAKLLWEEATNPLANNDKRLREMIGMLDRGEPFNLEMTYGKWGYTPLLSVCIETLNNTELFYEIGSKLINKGAKINVTSKGGHYTPLNNSVSTNQGIAEKILEKVLATPDVIKVEGTDIALVDKKHHHESPLYDAIATLTWPSNFNLKLKIIAQLILAGAKVHDIILPWFMFITRNFGDWNDTNKTFILHFIPWILSKLPNAWEIKFSDVPSAFNMSKSMLGIITDVERAIAKARFKNELKDYTGRPNIKSISIACDYELPDIAIGLIAKFLSQDILLRPEMPEENYAEALKKLENKRIQELGPVLKLCCKPSMVGVKNVIEELFERKGLPLPKKEESCAIAGGRRRSRHKKRGSGKGRRTTRSRKF